MNIIFRVDSSTQTGAGHLMRCLTLANELKKKSFSIAFICGDLLGNLISEINFPVYILSKDIDFKSSNLYLNSLGSTQEYDADQSIKVLPKNLDLLVVDNYALDNIWHQKLRPFTNKLMVIDDLADKQFDCDILLNQNLGIKSINYKNKVADYCKLLLGSDYALLRREFSEFRKKAIKKRRNIKKIKNLLISMGGSDIENITYEILQQLGDDYNIVVVLGKESPHNNEILKYAKNKNIKVIVNANNMAELMLNADLSIGASGSTNWERLCLGLPSLVYTVAENQKIFSKNLDKLGLIRLVGDSSNKNSIRKINQEISSITNLSDWSDRCFNSFNGNGVYKVVDIIQSSLVSKD